MCNWALISIALFVFKYDTAYMKRTPVALRAAKQSESLVNAIFNNNYYNRMAAVDIAKNITNPQQRVDIMDMLLSVLKIDPLMPPLCPPYNGEQTVYSPKNVSLRILAEWADSSMMQLFFENIFVYCPFNVPMIDTHRNALAYPAVYGIIKIGRPALRPCLIELKKCRKGIYAFYSDYNEVMKQERIVFAMIQIAGSSEVKKILKDDIAKHSSDREPGDVNLKNVIKYIDDNKIEKHE